MCAEGMSANVAACGLCNLFFEIFNSVSVLIFASFVCASYPFSPSAQQMRTLLREMDRQKKAALQLASLFAAT
jgi:hypothetical protein